MLKLIGGRLYQWDLGRQMELHDPDGMQITEVDFCHPDDAEALVVIPDRSGEIVTVDIPNVLMQSDETIMAYECVGDVTISHIPKSVVGRERPADYVYTETQVLTYKALEERIVKLEQGSVSEEQVAQIEKNTQNISQLSEEIANLGTVVGNIPSTTETFTFTLEDGTEVVKEVYVKT